ncbi:hypothetical protein M9H77_04236 [Catharanthus roseus]|uniref:Uncharacterized protein n=1 Tax=Catharanthus roseus TaxID=4058 RepID=A0ACC0CE26_CATRO|nr:hypothetical protein M9H77_04236 [Catharanthus roseus]
MGFYRHIGTTTNTIAELWAVRDGLILARDKNISNIVLEVDAEVVVSLLSIFQSVSIRHVHRVGNKCADFLANQGCNYANLDYVCLFEPTPELGVLLRFGC